MKVHQAYSYELQPTSGQREAFFRHAGVARFVWNWGLERRIKEYKETGKSSSAMTQHKQLVLLKKTKFPWMYAVSRCAADEPLRNLDMAFKHFFRRCKEGKKPGFPRFKKRGIHDSFCLRGSIKVFGCRKVRLPRLGKVRTKESIEKLKGRILSATVSREADRWYVSFLVEVERPNPVPIHGEVIGVDLGLTMFAVLSNGEKIEKPPHLERALHALAHRQRALARKKKGSRNRKKAQMAVARAHRRVKCQRRDFLHKASSLLAKTKQEIVVEDLNVAGMARNRALSRRIKDAGWGEFRRMLKYKCEWYGSKLTVAPRFFPSTKTCSKCGHVKDKMSLSERTFSCPECGYAADRDANAALNLKGLAGSSPASACGGDVRPASSVHRKRGRPQRSRNRPTSKMAKARGTVEQN